ncbi:ribosomal protein S16 [Peniophora sp. CONT]|nr:ribosomal protein S16 [Peniophora sp. CONT]
MPVRLRLSMHGPKHSKIFHLVAVDQRKRRDAKPIELLGVYNPRVLAETGEKKLEWAVQRIKYWLEQGGAQPSKPVLRLLERGGIIPPDSKYHRSKTIPSAAPPPTQPVATEAPVAVPAVNASQPTIAHYNPVFEATFAQSAPSAHAT